MPSILPFESNPAQLPDMRCSAACQRREVVAALERRNDAPIGMPISNIHNLPRYPGIVLFHQPQRGHVVIAMGVKARGNENHPGRKTVQRRQPEVLDCFSEFRAAAVCCQWDIDHLFGSAFRSAIRIKRMLEGGYHHYPIISREDILRPVAMVHVEIDDRDTLKPVRNKGMGGADSNVVEETEPHRLPAAGMMSWGPHVAKGIVSIAANHHVRRLHHRAGSMKRGGQCIRVHCRIRIQMDDAVPRRRLGQGVDIAAIMDSQQLFSRGCRSCFADEMLEQADGDEVISNRRQSIRALRVVTAHVMQEAIGMMNERRSHALREPRTPPSAASYA